jgi:cell division protein FtsI/penicillin-binding protein 2
MDNLEIQNLEKFDQINKKLNNIEEILTRVNYTNKILFTFLICISLIILGIVIFEAYKYEKASEARNKEFQIMKADMEVINKQVFGSHYK